MKKRMTFFLFAVIQTAVMSQTSPDPIDIACGKCLDSTQNQSTMGMMNCAGQARDAWDKEMNKYYGLVMKQLTEPEKEKFKAAQEKWLAYRDSEFESSGTIYYDMQGTMWRVVAVNRQMDIIKQRALELKEYYMNMNPEE